MARPSLSLRIIPRFPAKVLPGDGIAIIRTGGSITVDMDWSNIQQSGMPVDPSTYEFTLRAADGSFIRVPVPAVIVPPVTWSTLSGKPSEFPPSPHTHGIPDITNLVTTLAGKVDTTAVIDVAHGGSGRATATAYGVIIGGTTATGAHQSVALGTAGWVLTSNGAGAAPTMQAPAPTVVPNGTVINSVLATYTSNANLTTLIPFDDTLPQNTEGTQILSASLTPTSTTNKIRARFFGFGTTPTAGDVLTAAMFNGGANAVQATCMQFGTANYLSPLPMEFEYTPGSTSAQTITVRVGAAVSTCRMNGTAGGRLFGGAAACTLVLEEIKA